ncbi:non-ribosomal peptide synthetase [Pleomorphovibrio marinus]|uniref:non-ribosomal peptide synthetase n=1 Tax=Pleomorphovibrio marinus TaxID=2164132 RepID=UPI0013004C17|nr:non-ribosomal peptide synthetase [Pleomorphovibrio marinus]
MVSLVMEEIYGSSKRFGEGIAVNEDKETLTYNCLEEDSDKVALYLFHKGLKKNDLIPIVVDKSIDFVVAFIGVLKFGGICVPVDPSQPQKVIENILGVLQPKFLLTTERNSKKVEKFCSCGIVSTIRLMSPVNLPKDFAGKANKSKNDTSSIIFTSGTTGTPKGVMISQENLNSSIKARIAIYGDKPKLLWLTSVGFDASIASVLWPLMTGGTIIIPAQEKLFNKPYLTQRLREADTLVSVPTYYQFLLENNLIRSSSLTNVILGGESIPPELIKGHFEVSPNSNLYNEYGPTECTIWATVKKVQVETSGNNIGKPLPHVQLALLNKDLDKVPDGHTGEIYISGEGVTSGYFKDKAFTEKSFIKLFNNKIWYKTGDLGKTLPNGDLEFLGRVDDQVKIAGHRIELAGIREKLLSTKVVKDSLVFAVNGKERPKELIACVVPSVGYHAEEFLAKLKGILNKVEIPNAIIEVDKIPLNLNGKVDYKKLHDLYEEYRIENRLLHVKNNVEDSLISLFNESTGLQLPEFNGSIYELGVNSIDLIRFVGKINRLFELDCSVVDLFKAERLELFLASIESKRATNQQVTDLVIPSNSATYEQESLWLNHQLGNDSAYHLNFNIHFEKGVKVDFLAEAVRHILKREVHLRTVFREEEGFILTEFLPEHKWSLKEWDVSHEPFNAEQVPSFVRPLMQDSFDLEKDFLIRMHVFHFQHHVDLISIIVHHIAFDKSSLSIFLRSLENHYNVLYKGGLLEEKLPENPPSFGYLQRVEAEIKKKVRLSYWKDRLKEANATIIEKQINSFDTRPTGFSIKAPIPVGNITFLKEVSQKYKSTEFALFLAAFKVLVYKYSFVKDQTIGITVSTRTTVDRERSVGYFINTIPIRSVIDPNESFKDFFRDTNLSLHDDFEHQLPISELAKSISHAKLLVEQPFFDILFNFEVEGDGQFLNFAGSSGKLMEGTAISSPFKITFSVHRGIFDTFVEVLYDSSYYPKEFIEGLLGDYNSLISQIKNNLEVKIRDISFCTYKSGSESTLENRGFNLIKDIEKNAIEIPDAIAITVEDDVLTFEDLNHRANQLSWTLLKAKKLKSILVATDRNSDLIIAILAIWKAGLTYVPINPELPKNRIEKMVKNSEASMVITSTDNPQIKEKFSGLQVLSLKGSTWSSNSVENPSIHAGKNKISHLIYTSGSTGEPKGVMITYGNLNAFFHWAKNEFRDEEFDVLLATSSASFDLSIFEFFYPLLIGKTVRILGDGTEILNHSSKNGKLFINTVPSVVDYLIAEGMDFSNVGCLNVAGEPFPYRFLEAIDLQKVSVRNLYGPTEDTTYSSCKKFRQREPVTIGRPIEGTYFYILSKDLEPCPTGITGEICIGGLGLSPGYLVDSTKTNEKFILDPVFGEGKKVYKTGDLGRFLANGEIEYKGRSDYQVKIRGYRIELTEIENYALKSGLVHSACVLLKTMQESDLLVGYVVPKSKDFEPLLIDFLKSQLPGYMVPSIWVGLDQFPLTPHGKVDRNKLLQYEVTNAVDSSKSKELLPANSTFDKIKVIWQELFSHNQLSLESNFFELGGHSLLAVRLIGKVNKLFELNLTLSDLYRQPTIKGMAELVVDLKKTEEADSIPRFESRPALIPLSYNQESLWILDRLSGSSEYHIPFILRLKGELEIEHFENSIKSIVEKHEVLRTIFEEMEGSPYQRIITSDNWHLDVDEFTFSENLDYTELYDYVESYFFRPFNLKRDYMLRCSLVRLPNNEFLWINVFHHIACDGWSLPIFYKEFVSRYTDELVGQVQGMHTGNLDYQYAEYAGWQKKESTKETKREKVNFWKQLLENHKNLSLPEISSTANSSERRGGIHSFQFDKGVTKKIRNRAKELQSSPFVFLLSVFNLLIYKFSQQRDFCIGIASSGRHIKGSEELIGYFVNPLPLRCVITESEDFIRFHTNLKKQFYDCLDHQDVPFEVIVSEVSPKRTYGVNPIFQVMFAADYPVDLDSVPIPNFKISRFDLNQTIPKFDLTCFVTEEDETFRISFEYSNKTFNDKTIQDFAQNYVKLMEQVTNGNITELGKTQFFDKSSPSFIEGKTTSLEGKGTIIQSIERNVALFPEKICVSCLDKDFTYEEINTMANRFANYLDQKGVGSGMVVGVCMPRSEEYVIAILGVLKTGAAYLPIDDSLPSQRINFMVNDGCQYFVSVQSTLSHLESVTKDISWEEFKREQEGIPSKALNREIPVNSPAYIIYTSGSTGKPKGVVLTHNNLINFVESFPLHIGISQNDKILSVSSVSFDIGILETLLPLVFGASLRIMDQMARKEPSAILEQLEDDEVTLMFATPTHWKMLLAYGWEKPFTKLKAISGGEPLKAKVADQLNKLCKEVWNIYGPTETTIFSTLKRIQKGDDSITVGMPIHNTEIMVLDEHQEVLPRGNKGEVTIAGAGVAASYLNRKELSLARFIAHPLQANRAAYLTGDMGYINQDGELVILGRMDHQVKIDGYRVELGEIEESLKGFPAVEEAIVTLKKNHEGLSYLIAFLRLKGKQEEAFTPRLLEQKQQQFFQSQLKGSLPHYMVPTHYVEVPNFPITTNGKIDRIKLEQLPIDRKNPENLDSGKTPLEEKLLKIWKDVLGIENLGIHDNFFEIGGNSLFGVKLISRLEQSFGQKIPLSVLFKHPTIFTFSAFLRKDKKNSENYWKPLVSIKKTGSNPPLYIVHGGGLNIHPFIELARRLPSEQPVYGFQALGLDGRGISPLSIKEIASEYIKDLLEQNPHGPYNLAGYSLGGIIAYEMAQQLKEMKNPVSKLIFFDTYAVSGEQNLDKWEKKFFHHYHSIRKRFFDLHLLFNQPKILWRIKKDSFSSKWKIFQKKFGKVQENEDPLLLKFKGIEQQYKAACIKYYLQPYSGEVHLIKARIQSGYLPDKKFYGWKPFIQDMNTWEVPGEHIDMLSEKNLYGFAKTLERILIEKKTNN